MSRCYHDTISLREWLQIGPGHPVIGVVMSRSRRPVRRWRISLLRIAMPTDAETGEFVADITLTRQSGTLENWKRLNHVFVGLLRKHFLHWRAVGQEERAGMFEEAREELNIENG